MTRRSPQGRTPGNPGSPGTPGNPTDVDSARPSRRRPRLRKGRIELSAGTLTTHAVPPAADTRIDESPAGVAPTRKPLALAGRRIHFVGIGGCGMSGLARLARVGGAVCTGSDLADSPTIEALQAAGIEVALEQTEQTVPDACDLLVISAAIKPDHPEVQAAKQRGVRIVKYAQLLGELMKDHAGVAVAGTHGKSSTTSMLSHILIACGRDPSFIVGAHCEQIGGGFRCGKSDVLIAEACEFDRSFHSLHPTHAIILNVEVDHLDMYSGIEEIVESFAAFARLLPDRKRGGSLLINHEMPHRMAITAGLECAVETIGFAPQADWQVSVRSPQSTVRSPQSTVRGPQSAACGFARREEVRSSSDTTIRPTITLAHDGEPVCTFAAPLPGEHMAYNAAAAAVTAHRLGCEWDGIARAIESFTGLDRRMQRLGEKHVETAPADAEPVTVVDDYGHHPTEVDTTLRALRRHYDPRRLICVFQPHQHSRTRFLLEEFAASFAEADLVIVPHIYFVRDSLNERHAVRAADLVDRLRQRGTSAMHLYPFEAIVEQLGLIARPGDLIVTMGAGDVWRVAKGFLKG